MGDATSMETDGVGWGERTVRLSHDISTGLCFISALRELFKYVKVFTCLESMTLIIIKSKLKNILPEKYI